MSTTQTITTISDQIVAGLNFAEGNAVSFTGSIVDAVKPLTKNLPLNVSGKTVEPTDAVRFAFGLARTAVANQTDLAVRIAEFYGTEAKKPTATSK